MEKAAFIIQFLVLVFIVWGLLLLVGPTRVNQLEKKVYRTLRLISDEKARKPMSQRSVIFCRISGLVYLLVCIFILLNMQLQFGKMPANRIPVWTTSTLHEGKNDSTLHQIVSELVQPLVRKQEYPGIVVATIADEESDITGFGRVNLNSDQAPSGDTIFEIGSISKVFTGILLADSIAQKKFSLDTCVTSLLPSIVINPDSQKDKITLGHLATHTSGLPRMPSGTFRLSQLFSAIIAGDFYRNYTEESMLKTISKGKLRHVPGEHLAYSNVGFGLLGLILSKQTGMDYHHMVETVIAHPLGLQNTGVYLDEEQRSRLATGYRSYFNIGPFYLAQLAENWEFPNCIAGAGGLRSTANDMLVFLAANMGRKESTLTSTLIHSHEVLFAIDNIQIGMGWVHKELPKTRNPIIYHDGGTGGYSSFLGFSKDGRFGVVVLSNSTKEVDYIGCTILETLTLHH